MNDSPEIPPIAGLLRAAVLSLRGAGSDLGDPADADAFLALLRLLYATGRRDLPLGRLFEGHVDAVQIMHRYGTPAQLASLGDALDRGAMLGVWNAEFQGRSLSLEAGRLSGGKSYASGAGVLTHALVTAATPAGPQLLLIDLAGLVPMIDRTWWRTTGMQRSETHLVSWSDVPVRESDMIGRPGDYAQEPWFSGGALRFVAVQAGGVATLFDQSRDHLVKLGRADNPHQAARLAALYAMAQSAADTVRAIALRWFDEPDTARLPRVAAARLAVADLANQAMSVAREAVGLQGMFLSHPLAHTLADLPVYLCQPAPDAQRMRVGKAIADGALEPAL
ncbi:acyl-CoA dehydrogenase [uncultured Sphingomonas sp.]|uniref:acyl-CoA dehydrogenase n=1 Tax=uncultured Sphingomonas sp. TaxID=158754 RepID=UPI0035C96753